MKIINGVMWMTVTEAEARRLSKPLTCPLCEMGHKPTLHEPPQMGCLLKDSVYYAEKAHEVLNEQPSERGIHSGLYFMSSSLKFLAQAVMVIEEKK
jgi:hypothetical protein